MEGSLGELIYLVYGLAFFTLGTVALVIRRISPVPAPLLRELDMLAAFGLLHGISEWMTMFLLAGNDTRSSIVLLWAVTAVTALSFAFLFAFGVRLQCSYGSWPQYARILPAVLFGLWIGASVLTAVREVSATSLSLPNLRVAAERCDVLSRYAIGFPASALAGIGFFRSARTLRGTLGVSVYRVIQTIALTFGGYAILAGLVVRPVAVGPASVVNEETFLVLTGLPVQAARMGIGIAAALLTVVLFQRIEHATSARVEALKMHEASARERERLGARIHDRVIQVLFSAGLQVEAAAKSTVADSEREQLERARESINRAIGELRDFIAGAERKNFGVDALRTMLVAQCEALEATFGISVPVSVDLDSKRSRAGVIERPEEIAAIVDEATANAVRHGAAQVVRVTATESEPGLSVRIDDDGDGSRVADAQPGTGMRSMNARAARLGAYFTVHGDRTGTSVSLCAPWRRLNDSHEKS